MGATERGIVFPEASGVPRRQALQDLAESTEAALDTLAGLLPFAVAAGSIPVTLSGSNVGNAAISFPAGKFTVAPLVLVSLSSAPGGTQKFIPRAISTNLEGTSVYVYTGDSTAATASVTVTWVAVQMTETTAAG